MPPDPTYLTSILISPFHLCLRLPSGLFLSSFPTTILCIFLLSPVLAICLAYLILLHMITQTIFGEEYRL